MLLRVTVLLWLAAGCAASAAGASKSGKPGESAGGQAACRDVCPMQVEGAQVSYTETPDGAALVFTTDRGDVVELQRRVAQEAEQRNRPVVRRKASTEDVAHTARADSIERGARLIVTPADTRQLDALRRGLRARAERLGKRCSGEGCSCDCEG
jgi:hypothetical protein